MPIETKQIEWSLFKYLNEWKKALTYQQDSGWSVSLGCFTCYCDPRKQVQKFNSAFNVCRRILGMERTGKDVYANRDERKTEKL